MWCSREVRGADKVRQERKKALEEGKALFASKPKKGIAALLAQGMISDSSPEGIARWLHETRGLSMAAIGDYMGEDDPVRHQSSVERQA